MKGDKDVIDTLNRLLTEKLSAMDQYFVHAHMYEDWGLNELYERIAHESDDEKAHAAKLVQRILFSKERLMLPREALNIGKDVEEMLRNDPPTSTRQRTICAK